MIFVSHVAAKKENEQSPFRKWINMKYLRWQVEQGERATVTEFAGWLGLPRGAVSHYLNGIRVPSGTHLEKVAAKLGEEAYWLIGEVPPRIKKQIDAIPPGQYDELERIIAEWLRATGWKD